MDRQCFFIFAIYLLDRRIIAYLNIQSVVMLYEQLQFL